MELQRKPVIRVLFAVCCISRYNWIILMFWLASLIVYRLYGWSVQTGQITVCRGEV